MKTDAFSELFRQVHGYRANVRRPLTFSEKIHYRKLFDRDLR